MKTPVRIRWPRIRSGRWPYHNISVDIDVFAVININIFPAVIYIDFVAWIDIFVACINTVTRIYIIVGYSVSVLWICIVSNLIWFFVATIAATAIIVSVNNQQYYYNQGVYYVQSNSGYTVIEAPVGATVTVLPEGSQTVIVNETTNNYYYGGTYYEKTNEGYTVVPPTAGTVVESLPEGGEEIKIGEITYVKVGEVYYQPIEKDGKNLYEVVEVTEASW